MPGSGLLGLEALGHGRALLVEELRAAVGAADADVLRVELDALLADTALVGHGGLLLLGVGGGVQELLLDRAQRLRGALASTGGRRVGAAGEGVAALLAGPDGRAVTVDGRGA